MKILIVDDSATHRKVAQVVLKEHKLTVVGSYEEAETLLTPQTDRDEVQHLLAKAGYATDFNPYRKEVTAEERRAFQVAEEKAEQEATSYPDFDVVLLDLLLPASKKQQGSVGQKFVGQEMPLGTTLALLALKQGIKRVAIVTDTGHHDHPASAAFDIFRGNASGKDGNEVFNIGEVRMLCDNFNVTQPFDEKTCETTSWEFLESPEEKAKYPERKGVFWAKAWHKTLAKLLK